MASFEHDGVQMTPLGDLFLDTFSAVDPRMCAVLDITVYMQFSSVTIFSSLVTLSYFRESSKRLPFSFSFIVPFSVKEENMY